MIDWSHVRRLRDEIGADAFDEVVELFVDEVETEISRLRASGKTPDLEAQLHFVKGSALNLGFVDVATLCERGEAAAANGQADAVDVTEIIDCLDRSKAGFLAGLDAQMMTA